MQPLGNCPNCHRPIRRPGQKVCVFCAQPLAGFDTSQIQQLAAGFATSAVPSLVRLSLGIASAEQPSPGVAIKGGGRDEAIDTPSDTPAPAPEGAAALPAWLAQTPPARPLGEIYLELGTALAAKGAHRAAVDEFRRALTEDGSLQFRRMGVAQLTRAAEAADDAETALRAWLEAAALDRSHLPLVLARAHRWFRPSTILSLARWIQDDWLERVDPQRLTAVNRAAVEFILGRVQLFLAAYPKALDHFRQAADLAPSDALEWSAAYLKEGQLPPAFATPPDGSPHFLLAQIDHVFGHASTALEHVDRALKLGWTQGNYPDAPALRLKGELLESSQRFDEAAECFYRAGRKFGWRGEYVEGSAALEIAARLRPKHSPTYWYWMDWQRNLADAAKTPLLKRLEHIRTGLQAWRLGRRIRTPEPDYSWAWTSRALLNDLVRRWLHPEPHWQQPLLSEAAAQLECAALANPRDAYAHAYLGRFYRYLSLHETALTAVRAATAIEPENSAALEEEASLLCDLGRFDEAGPAVDRCRKVNPGPFSDALKAFVLLHTGERAEAHVLLESLVAREPENTWYLDMRSFCRFRLDRIEEARQDCRAILSLPNAGPSLESALAHFRLGEFSVAAGLFEDLRSSAAESPGTPQFYLALCQLGQGRFDEARRNADEAVRAMRRAWAAKFFEESELPLFRNTIASHKQRAHIEVSLHEIAETLRVAVRRFRAMVCTPETELEPLAAAAGPRTTRAAWSWIAAQAALGRLQASRGNWVEAAAAYRRLLPHRIQFPEVLQGLAQVVRGIGQLQTHGLECLRRGATTEALEKFLLPARDLAGSIAADQPRLLLEIDAQIGCARFLGSDTGAATGLFLDVLRRAHLLPEVEPGAFLGGVCATCLPDPSRYWALYDHMLALEGEPAAADVRPSLSSARTAMQCFLDDRLGLSVRSAASSGYVPMVTPVVVEIEGTLVPPDSGPTWPLLRDEIPAMRKRLGDQTGVEVPVVRLRGNEGDLPTGCYILMLSEVPLVMGTVQHGMRYAPVPISTLRETGLALDQVIEAKQPGTDQPGCWVPEAAAAAFRERGIEVWPEVLSYMVRHLEAVLRRNLGDIVDAENGGRMLEQWSAGEPGKCLIPAALPDAAARLAFTRLLRRLLAEYVPVANWSEILRAFQACGGTSAGPLDALRAARLRLRSQLPGNEPSATRFPLPPATEARLLSGVRREQARVFFALLPEDTQEALAEIRTLVANKIGPVALVVQDPELRPFARRLVELEFPNLAVLAAEEVIAPPAPPEPVVSATSSRATPSMESSIGGIRTS